MAAFAMSAACAQRHAPETPSSLNQRSPQPVPRNEARPEAGVEFGERSPGWFVAGSNPDDYRVQLDGVTKHGSGASSRLTAINGAQGTFGTLMQTVNATKYRGKRLRLSAFVKTDSVREWSGVWMRVDGEASRIAAFDNMQNRPIRGTTAWTQYDVVLDVALDAATVNFGVLQAGLGETWIDDVILEVVDPSVAVTQGSIARTMKRWHSMVPWAT